MDHQCGIEDPHGSLLESPASMMEASIQSHQISALEIDESQSGETMSKKVNQKWQLGMPWFVGTSQSSSPNEAEPSRYYGGLMKVEKAPEKKVSRKKGWFQSNRRNGNVSSSRRTLEKTRSEDESIGDFSNSEWTPPDSSYGAACPVCGWMPKHVRRMIEFSLIGLTVLGLLWLVISASIHVSNSKKDEFFNNATTFKSGAIADDDFYVETTSYKSNSKSNQNLTYTTFTDDSYADADADGRYYTDDATYRYINQYGSD